MNNLTEQQTKAVAEEAKKPLYTIERMEKSFRIVRPELLDATVSLISSFSLHIQFNNYNCTFDRSKFINLMNFHDLKKSLTTQAGHQWNLNRSQRQSIFSKASDEYKENKQVFKGDPYKGNLHPWMWAKMNERLGLSLYPEWKHLLSQIDPTVYLILKKFFSIRGPKALVPHVLLSPKIYQDKHIVNDLLNYNAIYYCLSGASYNEEGKLIFALPNTTVGNPNDNISVASSNWREIFTKDSVTYKALNKTLDAVPRCLPANYLFWLKEYRLTEPITDRIKLRAICCALECTKHNRVKLNLDCIIRSSPEQIRHAFRLYKDSLYRRPVRGNRKKARKQLEGVNLRGSKGLTPFIQYLCDYDEVHTGEIVGLFLKSHEWHRTGQYNYAIRGLDKKTPTKLPPIPLPQDKEIRFLATVDDIAKEGLNMNHCIASYAGNAIDGVCYLFHCDKDEDTASIMVDYNGRVVQSYGPYNHKNEASIWAENTLAHWGKKLAEYKVANNIEFKNNGVNCAPVAIF